ncbi:hypothetical protein L218DRAFT_983139 [Marasmius fiardii PR-910]|nr:hypothetical protein L218DRAFT_983139 [Marasmius fiardii PR-910]
MFTVKATYRGETRKFTFSDSTVFPSFHQIYLQLYRVFPISHNYYLSKLLFSPDSKSRILLAREIHGEEDYGKALSAQTGTKSLWTNPLLKFFVYDETPHKLPALPSPFTTTTSSTISTASTTPVASTFVPGPTPSNGTGVFSPFSFSLIPPPPIIFSTPVQSLNGTPRPRSPISEPEFGRAQRQSPQQSQAPVHVPECKCRREVGDVKWLLSSLQEKLDSVQRRLDKLESLPPSSSQLDPSPSGKSTSLFEFHPLCKFHVCYSCGELQQGPWFDCEQCLSSFCHSCGAGTSYFPHVVCKDGGFKHTLSPVKTCAQCPDSSKSTARQKSLTPSGKLPCPLPLNKAMSPPETSIYPPLCMFKWCWKCSLLKQGPWYSCKSCSTSVCPQCVNSGTSFCAFDRAHEWKKQTCHSCPKDEPLVRDADVPMGSPLFAPPSPLPLPQVTHLPSPPSQPLPRPSPTLPSPPMHIPGLAPTPIIPEEPVAVHRGVQCDKCDVIPIRGVRHKCLDCIDYDLCTNCISNGGAESHNPFHEFFEVNEPGRVVVHTVYSGNGEREVPRNRSTLSPPPPASPPLPSPPVVSGPSREVIHCATCNLCDSRIRGSRYKCLDCPDFDTCEDCFSITPAHHPRHSFVKFERQEQYIRRDDPDRPMHYAVCDSCQKGIWGVRYKCMHSECPDFDLCEDCEALPIPVHPKNHPLLKMRDPETVVPVVTPIPQGGNTVPMLVNRSLPPSPVTVPVLPRDSPLPTLPRILNQFDIPPSSTPSPPLPPRSESPSSRRSSPPLPALPGKYESPLAYIPNPFKPESARVDDVVVKPPSPFFYADSERSVSPPTFDYRGASVRGSVSPEPGPGPANRSLRVGLPSYAYSKVYQSPPTLPTPTNIVSQDKEWDPEEFWKRLLMNPPSGIRAPTPPAKQVSFQPWLSESVPAPALQSPSTKVFQPWGGVSAGQSKPSEADGQRTVMDEFSSPSPFNSQLNKYQGEAALEDSWPLPPFMTMPGSLRSPPLPPLPPAPKKSVNNRNNNKPETIQVKPAPVSFPLPPPSLSSFPSFRINTPPRIPTPPVPMTSSTIECEDLFSQEKYNDYGTAWSVSYLSPLVPPSPPPSTTTNVTLKLSASPGPLVTPVLPAPVPPLPPAPMVITVPSVSPSISPSFLSSRKTVVMETVSQTRILPEEEVKESRVQLPPTSESSVESSITVPTEVEDFWGFDRGVGHLTAGGEKGTSLEQQASFEKDLLTALGVSERERSSTILPSPSGSLKNDDTAVEVTSPLIGELLNRPATVRTSSGLKLQDILNDMPTVIGPLKEDPVEPNVQEAAKYDHDEPLISAFQSQLSLATRCLPRLDAEFISDCSVPDGQIVPPGAEFVKIWRMRNSGGNDWDENTEVVWVGGDNLSKGLESSAKRVGVVEPCDEVDVHVGELKAPEREGRYVGYYRLRNGDGKVFGDSIWLDITVREVSSLQNKEENQDSSESSSDEYRSLSSSSVVVMPQTVDANDIIVSRASSSSMTDNVSDNGTNSTSDPSSISLISDVESDEEWEESREQTNVEEAEEYVVLYDDDSE